jgi:hypothetical protein
MTHFSQTSAEARGRFRAAAATAGARLTAYPMPGLRGLEGEKLAVDVAELGNPAASRLAIAIAGTHGAEGYAARPSSPAGWNSLSRTRMSGLCWSMP